MLNVLDFRFPTSVGLLYSGFCLGLWITEPTGPIHLTYSYRWYVYIMPHSEPKFLILAPSPPPTPFLEPSSPKYLCPMKLLNSQNITCFHILSIYALNYVCNPTRYLLLILICISSKFLHSAMKLKIL